jgi:hypothetical protein
MKLDAAAKLLADEAAAEAAALAGPAVDEASSAAGHDEGLHLMSGKEKKKWVKKANKRRAAAEEEPYTADEIAALFAPPAEKDESELAAFVAEQVPAAAPPAPPAAPAAAPAVAAAAAPSAATAPLALDAMTVNEVGEWLTSIRLSVFVDKMAEDEYDGETLADDEFGMDDIVELEVGKKPHCKKLLKAIVAARKAGVDASLVPSRS